MERKKKLNSQPISGNNIPNGTVQNGVKKHERSNGTITNNDLRDLITNGLKERVKEIREDVLDQVTERIDDMVSEIMQKVETANSKTTKELINSDKYCDKVQTSSELLPTKQFQERNSLLTDLFEIPHIRTIYTIFIVILILLSANTVADDILSTGMPTVGINIIAYAFGKFPIAFQTWMYMKLSVIALYFAFCAWAQQRQEFTESSAVRKMWDWGCLIAFISYQIIFIILPAKTLVNNALPFASSLFVLMEQVRLLMKSHAFVRSCAGKFISYKPHTETPKPKEPNLTHFLYFLFAPTLVYRDSYPRTRRIRWGVVAQNFLDVIMTIFFCAFVFERYVVPSFKTYGTSKIDGRSLVLNIFASMLSGMLFFLSMFYFLLHSWLNGFAELLRFADRLFYKDWWNATTFNGYYRTWNVVVHDWLHTYIYKDIYENATIQNKLLSTYAVFMISAIFHEYIIAFTLKFFYPVLLVFFGGIGFALQLLRLKTGNGFIWMSLIVGNGLLVSLYSIEYYARVNCPVQSPGLVDLFIPRSWYCPV